ncbi:MAG: hypothetical protein EOM91_13385 [Sphingobacteriia bacterium]|nr:hypothetical protein [Sphingobacteriia bacterium]NCC39430.1 hypothetical protein [Gammaproteobacteria bacterium]
MRSAMNALLLLTTLATPALAAGPAGPMPGVPPHAGPMMPPWAMPQPFAPFAPPIPHQLEPGRIPGDWPARPAIRRPGASHLAISRQSEPDAYSIAIALTNIDPAQVEIIPRGQGLSITYRTQSRQWRAESRAQGDQHGYSQMSSMASQHLALPPDANLRAMSREQSADRILLRIPRDRLGPMRPWGEPSWPGYPGRGPRP